MSLELQEHCSLKPYNTFGIDVRARLLAHARDEADVREALALARERGLPLLVIGGGSNLLLTRDVEALVLRMASQGRRIVSDAADSVLVEAEAGEAWDPFVQWSLERGLAGLENLSLIPGTVLGNAGSFFKNPLVDATQAERLRQAFPDLVGYPQADGRLKLAAGWLIDKGGWKGFRDGPVGVHAQQALVLVNHGGATGAQVRALAERIQEDVRRRFGVELEPEPNLY